MQSVFDPRPRAILDNNVLGDLLSPGGEGLRLKFADLVRDGVAFHVNEYVSDEIFVAIAGQVQHPRAVAELLMELLDRSNPVLPIQQFHYGLAGFGRTSAEDCARAALRSRAEFVGASKLFARMDRLDHRVIALALEGERRHEQRRIEYADSLRRPNDVPRIAVAEGINLLFDELLPHMTARFDAKHGAQPTPAASVRCDAFVRSHTLLAARQWHDKRPADLKSRRHRGAMYDQCMLGYLATPAYLITGDADLRNRVRDARSYQASWIMTAPEFLGAWDRGNVQALSFPNPS